MLRQLSALKVPMLMAIVYGCGLLPCTKAVIFPEASCKSSTAWWRT
jgi:hypothetical protein